MQPNIAVFLDENHCGNKRLLEKLAAEDVLVIRHSDRFAPGTPDIEWLPVVGKNGWVLITTDKRIRRRELERQAVKEHRVKFFCFTSNDMSGQEMADALGKALPDVKRIANEQTPPFVATISKGGVVAIRDTFNDS